MGGWLSLLSARARPHRLDGLVLIAASPDFTERMLLKGLSAADRATLERDGRLEHGRLAVAAVGARPAAPPGRLGPDCRCARFHRAHAAQGPLGRRPRHARARRQARAWAAGCRCCRRAPGRTAWPAWS